MRTPHNVRGLNTSPEQFTAHVSGQRRMFGFDPGFGIDSELLDRFQQAIGVGVRHSTRKIIFGSIALDTAAIEISRELGELPVRCFERKKGIVVPACRFWPIARGSHDHERESAGRIVGHDKSCIRRKTRRGNVLEAPRHDGTQIVELLFRGGLPRDVVVSEQLCPSVSIPITPSFRA